jgi:hypothetical protein
VRGPVVSAAEAGRLISEDSNLAWRNPNSGALLGGEESRNDPRGVSCSVDSLLWVRFGCLGCGLYLSCSIAWIIAITARWAGPLPFAASRSVEVMNVLRGRVLGYHFSTLSGGRSMWLGRWHPACLTGRTLLSDNVRQVECWFSHIACRGRGCGLAAPGTCACTS